MDYAKTYWRYLHPIHARLNPDTLNRISTLLAETDWEDPQSPQDWNHVGVLALIEAEFSEEKNSRLLYLEMAQEALSQGANQDILCLAHGLLLQTLTGEAIAVQAFQLWLSLLQPLHTADSGFPPGLVYLPISLAGHPETALEQLESMLQAPDLYTQTFWLVSEVLRQARHPQQLQTRQTVFYTIDGLRLLQLTTDCFPASAHLNLQLGIAKLLNKQIEGILNLQTARRLAPENPAILQALYLAYQEMGDLKTATYWWNLAEQICADSTLAPWHWLRLDFKGAFTCLPFETDLALTVEASFQSAVTSTLLAQGDWFESELEWWRNWLQPGMTVIDVGANVGLYTFSAAKRVGEQGRVLAIEPFSKCVQCLEATCQTHQFEWVMICAGAASDQEGVSQLLLHERNEGNRLMTAAEAVENPEMTEEIYCFTLDQLLVEAQLDRVDVIKIDAEGCEIQVLQGSETLLSQFAPVILYENMDSELEPNLPVAEFLQSKGYHLYRYQPYIQELIPITAPSELETCLNVIALPPGAQEIEG